MAMECKVDVLSRAAPVLCNALSGITDLVTSYTRVTNAENASLTLTGTPESIDEAKEKLAKLQKTKDFDLILEGSSDSMVRNSLAYELVKSRFPSMEVSTKVEGRFMRVSVTGLLAWEIQDASEFFDGAWEGEMHMNAFLKLGSPLAHFVIGIEVICGATGKQLTWAQLRAMLLAKIEPRSANKGRLEKEADLCAKVVIGAKRNHGVKSSHVLTTLETVRLINMLSTSEYFGDLFASEQSTQMITLGGGGDISIGVINAPEAHKAQVLDVAPGSPAGLVPAPRAHGRSVAPPGSLGVAVLQPDLSSALKDLNTAMNRVSIQAASVQRLGRPMLPMPVAHQNYRPARFGVQGPDHTSRCWFF